MALIYRLTRLERTYRLHDGCVCPECGLRPDGSQPPGNPAPGGSRRLTREEIAGFKKHCSTCGQTLLFVFPEPGTDLCLVIGRFISAPDRAGPFGEDQNPQAQHGGSIAYLYLIPQNSAEPCTH